MSDTALRRMPLLRELFAQWRENRAALAPGVAKVAFSRDWEKLLVDTGLLSADERREALADADTLEAAGFVTTRRDRSRRYQIERIAIPLAAEERLRVLFSDELTASTSRLDLSMIEWASELAFLSSARVSVAAQDLLYLNKFFQDGGSARPLVPIKERSLHIFGDEKRLDALRATTLFRDDRLTLESVRAFVAAEPLGWRRGPVSDPPVLVVENAATFDSYVRWNAEAAQFSAIIYGGGNRFIDSVVRLPDIFAELGGTRRVLYFGDLDAPGLRIPYRALSVATRSHLPTIEPDLCSYRWLLNRATAKSEESEIESVLTAEIEWLRELAPVARNLIAAGQRLAQEHIGWEFLREQRPDLGRLWTH